jgi:hypothetical protein
MAKVTPTYKRLRERRKSGRVTRAVLLLRGEGYELLAPGDIRPVEPPRARPKAPKKGERCSTCGRNGQAQERGSILIGIVARVSPAACICSCRSYFAVGVGNTLPLRYWAIRRASAAPTSGQRAKVIRASVEPALAPARVANSGVFFG